MAKKTKSEEKLKQNLQDEATKQKFYALPPIMKYVFHQMEFDRYKKDRTYTKLVDDLGKAWNLVQALVRFPQTGPVQEYYHMRNIYKPKPSVAQIAHYALTIADEMTRRCCWIYDQKNELDKLHLIHPAFIMGREKMKPWVFAFERKDIPSDKAKKSYTKWVQMTDLGKRYESVRKNYTYALSGILKDFDIDRTVICPKKWFLHPEQTLLNRQRKKERES